jgi:hypothetical protein
MIELLRLQPAEIAHRPALLAWIDTSVLEHEGAHMLPEDPKCLNCGRPGADEIPHGFVAFIGNPYRRQFASAQQPGQSEGIPAVCLQPITGLPWDQRWGDHHAFMAKRSDQPIETVAGRAGLVAEMDSIEPGGDPLSITRRMLVSDASTSPKKRTSPSRPASAIAFFSFATSIPTNASL